MTGGLLGSPIAMTVVESADPYSWPHDAKMEPATTAVIVIDMQVLHAPTPSTWPPRWESSSSSRCRAAPAADVVQVDFVGKGGYVDMMGYDLAAMQAPIGPIQCAPLQLPTAMAKQRAQHHKSSSRPVGRCWRLLVKRA